ncbi:serine hydrolase domain-containing protein [Vagococcus vulneris]|uniref:Beta-lactamase-related domain-containing protein n=1 Tax=Vagococcus vulneris TaxID=1977869 RepID=A0A429ZSF9_9ENTE|nr:serine hydrolase [Vagococcus vulneris]RST96568.1 hypothetical protein CBF37_10995 [Vagococcus vulneris]
MARIQRTEYEQLKKKHRRRRLLSLLFGLIFGLIVAFNLYYWFPLIKKKIDLPNIPQARLSKTEPTKSGTSYDNRSNIPDSETGASSFDKTVTKSEEPKFNPRTNYEAATSAVTGFFQPLSQEIDNEITAANISGTLLVVKDNQPILYKSYGEAENQTDNPYNSSYMIASSQKALTATLIMKLVEENKLSLDTPLSEFYPEIANSDKVTINSMLSMTSGLTITEDNRPQSKTKQEMLDYVIKTVTYQQLTKWKYSYSNYVLLAGIIEKLSQKSYEDYADEIIIKPLNLKNTFFYDRKTDKQNLIAAYNHNIDKGQITKQNIPDYAFINEFGSGNLAMSTSDYLTFVQALIDGKVLEWSSVINMWTLQPAPYSYTYKAGFYHSDTSMSSHGLFWGYEPTVHINNDASTAVIYFANMYQKDKTNVQLVDNIFQKISAPYNGFTFQNGQ